MLFVGFFWFLKKNLECLIKYSYKFRNFNINALKFGKFVKVHKRFSFKVSILVSYITFQKFKNA